MSSDKSIIPAATLFPYNAGPKVRDFATSLLFHEKLNICLPGWVSNNPLDAFYKTGARAQKTAHRLSSLFDFVFHNFHTAQEVATRETEHLIPLQGRISNILLVHPGTPENYSRWEPFHEKCFPIAAHALENIHVLHAAVIEFIFRIYELYLIENEDPDKVLEKLDARAKAIGGDSYLLVECALHRFTIPSHGVDEWVTDLPHIPAVLAEIGDNDSPSERIDDIRSSGLSFHIFDYLLRPYAPRLDSLGIEQIIYLFENHGNELIKMRAKCSTEALSLVQSMPSSAQAKDMLKATLLKFEEEVSHIARINKNSFNDMMKKILEDNTSWATFAGFLGAGVTGMPATLVATLGIAAFSTLGANAIKAKSDRDRTLKSSPWAFVHYINK
ncbi:hypothetical protein [Ectopseudomonas mendocina]|uniref:hypothetical protein n=1 Tax=Ectopseudomonas mendocina TaxID=300 RepID=UPI000B24226F|nr:hypothetical protein [Pseudomonas mendocina]VEE17870.1 Uncharacterised protein [Pseudomonas mendocina]